MCLLFVLIKIETIHLWVLAFTSLGTSEGLRVGRWKWYKWTLDGFYSQFLLFVFLLQVLSWDLPSLSRKQIYMVFSTIFFRSFVMPSPLFFLPTQLFFFFFLSSASLPRLPMLEWLAALLMLDILSDECCRLIRRSANDRRWADQHMLNISVFNIQIHLGPIRLDMHQLMKQWGI